MAAFLGPRPSLRSPLHRSDRRRHLATRLAHRFHSDSVMDLGGLWLDLRGPRLLERKPPGCCDRLSLLGRFYFRLVRGITINGSRAGWAD